MFDTSSRPGIYFVVTANAMLFSFWEVWTNFLADRLVIVPAAKKTHLTDKTVQGVNSKPLDPDTLADMTSHVAPKASIYPRLQQAGENSMPLVEKQASHPNFTGCTNRRYWPKVTKVGTKLMTTVSPQRITDLSINNLHRHHACF